MEHFFQAQGNCDEVEIRRNVTKLYGQTSDRKAHEIQRVVVEEKYDRQEYAKHKTVLIRSETESVVEPHNEYEQANEPNDVVGVERFGDLYRIAQDRLRRVNGHHDENDTGEGNKEANPLPFVFDIEVVFFPDLQKQGDRNGERELENEICVTEPSFQMQSVPHRRKKIDHIVVKEDRRQNRERQANITRYISKQPAFEENRHGKYRIVEIIAPTKNELQIIGCFVPFIFKPRAVDDVDKGVG